ncbi:MAG: hypothetical protein K0R80_2725 [Clostridia bacterium]|nr:hypothetical protein [Clostridia bacterium]
MFRLCFRLFSVGIIIAVTGGILIAYDNSALRKKVLKTPLDQEVEEDKEPDKMNWSYVLFCSGLVIVLVAIALGEI